MEETMMIETTDSMTEINDALNGMFEDDTIEIIEEKGGPTMTVHTHMRGTNLFVPGIKDPRDVQAVLDTLGMGPVWMALSGGGTFLMGGQEMIVPTTKLRDISLTHAVLNVSDGMFEDQRFIKVALAVDKDEVKALRQKCRSEDVRIPGIALRLPPHLIRLQKAFEATLCGIPYNWGSFFKSYRKDLSEAMKNVIEEHVLTTPRMGIQAHAGFDPRIGTDEVGISRADARKLGLMLKKQMIDGRRVILGRYPSSPKTGFRFVTLRILDDQASGMIYLNAESWRDLHGGDFDGDLAYIMIDGWTEAKEHMWSLGKYPALKLTNTDGVIDTLVSSFSPVSDEKAIQLVMGMLIKKLTGSLTVTFHVLARSAAVNYVKNPGYPGTEAERMRKAYEGVFDVFHPVLEATMDARKESGKEGELREVARCLQNVMNGGVMSTDAFNIFLPVEMQPKFKNMVHLASGMNNTIATMSAVRNTATGRLIAAGKNGRQRATDNVVKAMLRRGVEHGEMLKTLQADAMGEEFFYQGRRNAGNGQAEEEEDTSVKPVDRLTFRTDAECKTLIDVFETITHLGKPLMKVLDVAHGWNGQERVVVRITPHWLTGSINTLRVVVDMPNPEIGSDDDRKLSEDGHMIITLPGCQPRVYRPRLRIKDDALHMETLAEWLRTVIAEALAKLSDMQAMVSANTAEDMLNSTLLEEFMALPGLQQKTKIMGLKLKQTASAMLLRLEYPLYVPPTKDVLLEWEMRERLMRLAREAGFDILSTSKNKPGELAYKAGRMGIPSYLWAINPFAQYLDPKRRPEPREIKSREALHHKGEIKLPTVRAKGSKLPVALAEGMRELVIMIADTNHNEWGQDTLLCTESLIDKMRLAMFDIECVDWNGVEETLMNLEAQGFDLSGLSICQREDGLGAGLTSESWIITVESEDGIRDLGKIKSCIGPVKGVPSLMPGVRLFCAGREIDLIVPRETIERKKALDFWLAMAHEALAYAKGEEFIEVDPNEDLNVLVECLRAEMDHHIGNVDGIQDITDEHGNVIGRAFVGAVPFFRPVQTKISTFKMRSANNPLSLELHAAIMAGTRLTFDGRVNEQFTSLVGAFNGSTMANMVAEENEDVSYNASQQ